MGYTQLLYTPTRRNTIDKYMDAHGPCSQQALLDGLMDPGPFKQQALVKHAAWTG